MAKIGRGSAERFSVKIRFKPKAKSFGLVIADVNKHFANAHEGPPSPIPASFRIPLLSLLLLTVNLLDIGLGHCWGPDIVISYLSFLCVCFHLALCDSQPAIRETSAG